SIQSQFAVRKTEDNSPKFTTLQPLQQRRLLSLPNHNQSPEARHKKQEARIGNLRPKVYQPPTITTRSEQPLQQRQQ
ncbi:hypothetical protein, partial [Algoriphagus sp.]|uniref:hypothetical protein n=1 Tax=Algoriphagus sp. TaxID=1872435 RepID=UPI003919C499